MLGAKAMPPQGLGEIRCIIDPGNTASHNVAGKLGFTKFAESHDVIGDLLIYRREPRAPAR